MTTNQTIDGVPRELAESIVRMLQAGGAWDTAEQLRALLDVSLTDEGEKPAEQVQGEPVAILSGPDDSVCWTQDSTPKEHRKQVVLIEHADLLRLQGLASGVDETVYQTRWCSLGEWEEWKTVSREKYERSDGQLFERRIVDAEQPAPVAQKYDDTLLPFLTLMRKELHANSHKGDREGWLGMNPGQAVTEVRHHLNKLKEAVYRDDDEAIKEHAADVANCAMMLSDICNLLETK